MRRCLGCFENIKDELELCPFCGYYEGMPSDETTHLPLGILIADRYIVGRVFEQDDTGITYYGWDKETDERIVIKEYIPFEIASRVSDSLNVEPYNDSFNKIYISGLDAFIDEAVILSGLESKNGIIKVFDCIEGNNTAYVVTEFPEGESLSSLISKRRTYSDKKALDLMMPILESVSMIHKEGIVHRNISPDCIYVTKQDVAKLTGFNNARYAIASRLKNHDNVISPGYSPEELYSRVGRQGPYTDVYSLAAILYKLVTGITPAEAPVRRVSIEDSHKDVLVKPRKINNEISVVIETAILNALDLDVDERTSTVDGFIEELISDKPVKRTTRSTKGIDLSKYPLWVKVLVPSLLVVMLICLVCFSLGVFKSDEDNNSVADESVYESISETMIEVNVDVLQMNDHSYAFYGDCDTWEDAEEYCENVGGHLAVITSQEENDALYAFALSRGYDNVYIGYSDNGEDGVWRWVNGEESDYTNWNPDEPNGFTESEDYAVLVDNGRWNDAEYSPRIENGPINFICEWDCIVNGTAVVTLEDLTINSVVPVSDSMPDSEIAEETIIEAGSAPMTQELAIQAFENYFFSVYGEVDTNIETNRSLVLWEHSPADSDEKWCVYKLSQYAGDNLHEVVYYYMDLNTGNVQSADYWVDSDMNLIGISATVFNGWNYLSGYESFTSDCSLDDRELYSVVMDFVDKNEADHPGSMYSIDTIGYWEDNNYISFFCLYIEQSNGEKCAYVIDDFGLLPVLSDNYISYVSYEVIKSYPCLVVDMYSKVLTEIPDGYYLGGIRAISDDGLYALVSLGEIVTCPASEVANLSTGDSIYLDYFNSSFVVSSITDEGDILLDDGPVYLAPSNDGNYTIRVENDDLVTTNDNMYLLRFSDGLQFEDNTIYVEWYGMEPYNNYISERGLTGNPIMDSTYYFYVRNSEYNGQGRDGYSSNGYNSIYSGASATVVNNEIVDFQLLWHP